MLFLLAAAVVAAEPVQLQPHLATGHVLQAEAVTRHESDLDPVADAPIHVAFEIEGATDDTIVLTTLTDLPFPVSVVHADLVVQARIQFAPDGAVLDQTILRDDASALTWWLAGPRARRATPTVRHDRETVAGGGCSPRAFRAILPRDPQTPGATWSVGPLSCRLGAVAAGKAQVACVAEGRALDDPWAEHSLDQQVTLVVDLNDRHVARCTSVEAHRRVIGTGPDSMVQTWTDTTVYQATSGPPRGAGLGLTTKAILLAGLAILGVLAVLVVAFRRPR